MNGKIVVFGGTGGLGAPLCERLRLSYSVTAVGKAVDITDPIIVDAFLIKEDPDIVINMAVQNIDGLLHKRDITSIQTQLQIGINGNINIFRSSIPIMRVKNWGRLIFISSILSRKPIAGTSIYSASKAFNDSLVRTVALENAKYHITSNSIQLGYFDGGLTNRVPEPVMKQVMEQIPLKRLGTIDELYKAILFLINIEYVTGSNLTMAGGLES